MICNAGSVSSSGGRVDKGCAAVVVGFALVAV